jgi:threonine/homoserine/homoserine lactone efflux protein
MFSTEFIITSLIVVLIPGTGVIYTISMGLLQGARASFYAAVGCTFGIVPHLLATILGLATILHMSAVAFQVVKFIGVAYLLYLAYSMWKERGALQLDKNQNNLDTWSIVSKGFLINILNPKLSLFFLAFLPQFVPTSSLTPTFDMFILSGIFMLMTFVIFVLYGIFANGMRIYVVNSPKIMRKIQKTFAVIFAILGLKLAMSDR